jgi:hypothetical protein
MPELHCVRKNDFTKTNYGLNGRHPSTGGNSVAAISMNNKRLAICLTGGNDPRSVTINLMKFSKIGKEFSGHCSVKKNS